MMEYAIEDMNLIPLDLQFFAEGEGGEKTEAATPKKLSDARKKGQVSKSKELTSAFELIAMFLTLKVFVGSLGTRFINMFHLIYGGKIPDFVMMYRDGLTVKAYTSLFFEVSLQLLLCCLPFLLVGVTVSFISDLVQVRWKVSSEPLKPSLNKINPMSGMKRIFSKQSLFELLKSIVKILLIGYIAYISIRNHEDELFILYEISLNQAVSLIGQIIIDTGLRISIFYIVLGLADWFYQKHKFNEDMKMTKQEVKDEYKDAEGDPAVKTKQKQRMREASQRRMMRDVPKADVVITNPTHIAVAIKYDPEEHTAPTVLAKGEDYMAQKIREAAKEANVPIMENKPLARALYATVDIGQEIPPELYEAVAEILALIYNQRNR